MNPQSWKDTTPANHPVWSAYFAWCESLELRERVWRNGSYSTYHHHTKESNALWEIFDALRLTLDAPKT